MLGTNLTFKTYIGYFELFGERVPLREIKKRLRASKLSNIVGELARINQCLNARACDDPVSSIRSTLFRGRSTFQASERKRTKRSEYVRRQFSAAYVKQSSDQAVRKQRRDASRLCG